MDFDKICVFCGKCCVCIDNCVFIVVKIKCVNSGRISDICDKVNFTTKLHTFYQNTNNILSKHTNIIIFNTFDGTVLLRDLRISLPSKYKHILRSTITLIIIPSMN